MQLQAECRLRSRSGCPLKATLGRVDRIPRDGPEYDSRIERATTIGRQHLFYGGTDGTVVILARRPLSLTDEAELRGLMKCEADRSVDKARPNMTEELECDLCSVMRCTRFGRSRGKLFHLML